MNDRLLIAGIGGIGGVIAARLVAAGARPLLLTANPSITEAIRQTGLQVVDRKQRRCYQAECYTSLEQVPAATTFSRALLLMKATNVVESARSISARLERDGYLVTCQNGIVEDAVSAAVGAGRVVSAIVGWGGTMHAPGVYEQTGPGGIHLGELDGTRNERVAPLFSAAHPAVLRLIKEVIRAGQRHDLPVSLCGEMASQPEYALLLIGMGLRTLSVAPPAIPQIKKLVRSITLQHAREVATTVMGSESEQVVGHDNDMQIVSYLRSEVRKVMPEAF